jgi:hypothetical protein
MEYYRGILFLTTNRVDNFDDAFVSRIHVVMQYERLSEKSRSRIWVQFLDKLEAERGDTLEIPRSARRFVQDDRAIRAVPWNGREIRNGELCIDHIPSLPTLFYFNEHLVLAAQYFIWSCLMSYGSPFHIELELTVAQNTRSRANGRGSFRIPFRADQG